MNAIGFKTQAVIEAEKNSSSNKEATKEIVIAQTVMRVEQLGSMIMGEEFQNLPPQAKVQMLNDFAYYKQVIESL